MQPKRLLLLAAAFSLAVAVLPAQNGAGTGTDWPDLFTPIDPNSVSRVYDEAAALRQVNAHFSESVLNGSDRNTSFDHPIEINLFSDVSFVADRGETVTMLDDGYVVEFSLRGGTELDFAAFAVVGDAMSGHVRFGSALYSVRHVGGGELTISEVQESALELCGGAKGRYKVSGDRAIQPSGIDDDGVRTYITWPADATLPAVYALDAKGNEALVNGMMRDDIFVIDDVAPRLVFRLDRQVARATRIAAGEAD